MFRIMLRKMLSKWWLNLCLLLGCTLFIATVTSFPLYQKGAYDRMLRDEFQGYLANIGGWPGRNRISLTSKKEEKGEDIREIEEFTERLNGMLGLTTKENIYYYLTSTRQVHSAMNRKDMSLVSGRIGALSGLKEHARMLAGEMYSDSGIAEDGSIEVVVSQAGFVRMQLLVGETITLDGLKDADGKEMRFVIKGVFGMEDEEDSYWQFRPDSMENVLLINEELFHSLYTGENAANQIIVCLFYSLFEYEDLKSEDVKKLLETINYLTTESEYSKNVIPVAYVQLLEKYAAKAERIRTTLTILQIPVLIMLAAFLFMISGQMYDIERNEISVIKSRGSSGGQIFRLYLYQGLFLTLAGGVLGLLLGTAFSRILGSARNFLEFDPGQYLEISFTRETWYYAAAAMTAVLLIMTLPAIRHSRVTIVKLKQQKALKKRSWWEKMFLDLILLAVSLYGYYHFHKNMEAMAESVIMGETLDPLLYVSSSLFIVGLGLLFLRIQPWIVRIIYLIGKRFWKPASYISFMENMKNGRKQQFIMLFLIMTISMGMYHAVVARTILQNAKANTEYLQNVDIVLMEAWKEILDDEGDPTGNYYEPDFERFRRLEGVEGCTRVLYDDSGSITLGKRRQTVAVMGIHTKEFGTLTWVDREYLGKHYYEFLNELAVKQDGVLVSENFRSQWGYQVGDYITFNDSWGNSMTGVIVDFFPYWPGYAPQTVETFEDGTVYSRDHYLVVTHFDLLRQKWGITPYEVWIDLKEGYDSGYMYDFIQENQLKLRKYVDGRKEIENTMRDPLLQGTNGILTMGFIVTLLLCAVGYLIYWIMSIRSRELIFGVLRASGMHKGELFHMLMNEQVFSGGFSVAAGIGIGKLTSKAFVPMMQQAYAAADQVLPMKLVTDATDMLRLYTVIAAVLVACLIMLIILLLKLNVAKALKLGEE